MNALQNEMDRAHAANIAEIDNLNRALKVMKYLLRREEAQTEFLKANLGTLRGCRDMLREAAKQFRLLNDNGHSVGCDMHADEADSALRRIE